MHSSLIGSGVASAPAGGAATARRRFAMIEAMAARLPVVAPAVGGVPDLVEDGVTGVLAPPGDAAALDAALAALACDPERRRALGEAAALRSAGLDTSVMVDRYAALFERVYRGEG